MPLCRLCRLPVAVKMQVASELRLFPTSTSVLAVLPPEEFARLSAHLELVTLRLGQTLYEPGDQLQHGIAQKFQLLIIPDGLRTFAGKGAVSKRLLKQFAIGELVAQRFFEIVQRKVLHKRALCIIPALECRARG